MIWTRDLVLKAAGYDPVMLVRRALQRTDEALDAATPEVTRYGGDGSVVECIPAGPDHAIRLRAADLAFTIAGIRPRNDAEPTDPSRPLAVSIVLANVTNGNGNGHAGTALHGHGVRLHRSDSNGSST